MAATPSVKVIKNSPFKSGSRMWSNRYHFNGGVPSGDTQWHALMDAVVAAEKTLYGSDTSIVECVGYDAGSDVPVSSKTYATAGTYAGGGTECPLEVCALLRYSTTARTSKNHPVYLFNYFHATFREVTVADYETLRPAAKTLIDTYASAWISGFSDGAHTLVRAGPNGATATGHQTETYLTHRDFPYTPSV